jgi:hypothetical protein
MAEVVTPADLRVFDMCPEANTWDSHTTIASRQLACAP